MKLDRETLQNIRNEALDRTAGPGLTAIAARAFHALADAADRLDAMQARTIVVESDRPAEVAE